MRSYNEIATDLLRCALTWEKDAKIIGNITAEELAKLAAADLGTCPTCGERAWVNVVDCTLCQICADLENEK